MPRFGSPSPPQGMGDLATKPVQSIELKDNVIITDNVGTATSKDAFKMIIPVGPVFYVPKKRKAWAKNVGKFPN
ncbi:MAG: hypothetical protein ACFCD0_14605 [Gemmataceae bacterium]